MSQSRIMSVLTGLTAGATLAMKEAMANSSSSTGAANGETPSIYLNPFVIGGAAMGLTFLTAAAGLFCLRRQKERAMAELDRTEALEGINLDISNTDGNLSRSDSSGYFWVSIPDAHPDEAGLRGPSAPPSTPASPRNSSLK